MTFSYSYSLNLYLSFSTDGNFLVMFLQNFTLEIYARNGGTYSLSSSAPLPSTPSSATGLLSYFDLAVRDDGTYALVILFNNHPNYELYYYTVTSSGATLTQKINENVTLSGNDDSYTIRNFWLTHNGKFILAGADKPWLFLYEYDPDTDSYQ